MAKASTTPRYTRGRILVALLALTLAAGARAEETDEPKQEQPAEQRTTAPATAPADAAKTPPGQKGGGGGRGGGQAAPAAAAEQHRLPPDSTTKHTLALPGRTLSFTAVAGSIRLFDDKGEPQADVAYTSYQLDGVDRAARPVTFLFNGGPGSS